LRSTGWALLYFLGVTILQTFVAAGVMLALIAAGVNAGFDSTELFQEGNEAFKDKNYDYAITEYEKAIKADPKDVGDIISLHINTGLAHAARGIDSYNKAPRAEHESDREAARKKCGMDLAASADEFVAAWKSLDYAHNKGIYDQKKFETTKLRILGAASETFQTAIRTTQVEQQVIDAAKLLMPEYQSLETDPTKLSQAKLIIADLYRVKGDSANAANEYKLVLASEPNNLDALANAGFTLVNIGYQTHDKNKQSEGAEYLRRFVSLAPDTNKFKTDAMTILDTLKKGS
jgi:tetratricopeptide (TPR) repeat protein